MSDPDHWLCVEQGVGRTVDAAHGRHGYKWLFPKWPHIQINCSNTVPINSNYKMERLSSAWLGVALSCVLLFNIYLGDGSQYLLLQVRKLN